MIWVEKIFLLAAVAFSVMLFTPVAGMGQGEGASAGDRLIGSAFKTLAHTFLQACDLEKIRAKQAAALAKMPEDKFAKRYARVYAVIGDLPLELRSKYGLTRQMSKAQAIREIRRLDKKEISGIIDAIGDQAIADQFKGCLKGLIHQMRGADLMGQVRLVWQKIMRKV